MWRYDVGHGRVDSLEVRAADRRDHAVLKQVFQGEFHVAPIPPTASPSVAFAVKLTERRWAV